MHDYDIDDMDNLDIPTESLVTNVVSVPSLQMNQNNICTPIEQRSKVYAKQVEDIDISSHKFTRIQFGHAYSVFGLKIAQRLCVSHCQGACDSEKLLREQLLKLRIDCNVTKAESDNVETIKEADRMLWAIKGLIELGI